MAARDDHGSAMSPLRLFGAELRHYRNRARMSQEQLAGRVFCSADLIAKIEKGQRTPSGKLTLALDGVPELRTEEALARLREHMRDALKFRAYPGWFHDWPDKEAVAKILRFFALAVVPGLLQTEAYARALLTGRIGSSADDVEEKVAARMERQAILDRDTPPELWAVLDGALLHRPVGGKHVMREQLNHLIEMARRPNIVIQVIPASVGVHHGLAGLGFVIADSDDTSPVAYQETSVRGQVIEDADDVAVLAATWDRVRAEALPRSASLELMEEVAKTWT